MVSYGRVVPVSCYGAAVGFLFWLAFTVSHSFLYLDTLGAALVVLATMLQMFVDWEQSDAMGLERISLELRVATLAAFLLTMTAFLLGLAAKQQRR